METPSPAVLGDRLLQALELWEFGVEMTALRLKAENPGASPDDIERLVQKWLRDRPGAEDGDGAGRVVPVPAP